MRAILLFLETEGQTLFEGCAFSSEVYFKSDLLYFCNKTIDNLWDNESCRVIALYDAGIIKKWGIFLQ